MADDTNTAEHEALQEYLKDCDAHAIVPDVGGAWHAAYQAGRASLAASAGSEPVAPSEDVQKKIQSNTWDHFGAILPTLKAISRGDWYWGANSRCKYIEIRLDTRDGGCILYDRDRVRISPEQFAHQHGGGFGKMEPWPASSGMAHPSSPEGMAGWRDIATAPKDEIYRDGSNAYAEYILVWYPGAIAPIRARWWQSDSDKCNFLADGGYAVFPTVWQPLPAPPLPASAKEL